MTDIFDPRFFEPFNVTWPEGTSGRVEIREFVDDDGAPVREVRRGDGEWRRFPVGADIDL